MKSLLPTILIISAGILAGCSSTPTAVIKATNRSSALPAPTGIKIHVVGQSPQKNLPSPDSHSIAPATSLGRRDNNYYRKQLKLSNAVAAEFAGKGYTIVSANEADYVVYAHLYRTVEDVRSKAVKDPYRTVSHQRQILSHDGPALPVLATYTYETNDWMDRPDMKMEPDDNLSLKIEIVRTSKTLAPSAETVWTGELFAKSEAASQRRYIQTLLSYLWRDANNEVLLASK